MSKKVAVVGSGSREHAIVLKLLSSNQVGVVYAIPGNPGIQLCNPNKVSIIDIPANDVAAIEDWSKTVKPDMVVVGPEEPLSLGLVDRLTLCGIACFGPTKSAALIESDKAFSKDFMTRHQIPTAKYAKFTDSSLAVEYIRNEANFDDGYVIKASGLAAGKGVLICDTKDEACEAVKRMIDDRVFGDAGKTVVVEELILGEECSVLAFCDGAKVCLMPAAQDHKRAFDGDLGPNTGGMGAICPFERVERNEALRRRIEDTVIARCVAGMKQERSPFIGCLFAGLMITDDDQIKVLEFNCRFGDPETQSVLALLETDLYDIFAACISHQLETIRVEWRRDLFACGVVLADRKYPESAQKGQKLDNLGEPTTPDDYARCLAAKSLILHSATKFDATKSIVTNGGRVLTAIGLDYSLESARSRAIERLESIRVESCTFRRDIGERAIARSRKWPQSAVRLSYAGCGVDIDKGNRLVERIKASVAQSTGGVAGGQLDAIGSFGALFDMSAARLKDPILVSGCDGVGTKLMLALECRMLSGVGVDLVAMCANDILVHGAKPLQFLDYYACGRLEVGVASEIIDSIVRGCELANCRLVGGETAEMPGLYRDGELDLAGFAMGAVERAQLLPKSAELLEGDVLIAIASSGVHSNGFSLVRKLLESLRVDVMAAKCPWPPERGQVEQTLAQSLLEPTRIYVAQLAAAIDAGLIKAMAHITGGGLVENVPRALANTPHLAARLDAGSWPIAPLFGWIQRTANVELAEMVKTFNCGLGMVCVVAKQDAAKVAELIRATSSDCWGQVHQVGELVKADGSTRCIVDNLERAFQLSSSKLVECELPVKSAPPPGIVAEPASSVAQSGGSTEPSAPRLPPEEPRKFPIKRVAILLSGSGTNAKSIIEFERREGSANCAYQVVLVVSNKADAGGLKFAQAANIDTCVIKQGDYAIRELFDMEIDRRLREKQVHIVCLAGFMRILSEKFVRLWSGRLINIHPSLLPSFKGMHAYKQALESGARITGCSVHFVSPGVDEGAIILQQVTPILPGDTLDSLSERGKTVENGAFPVALSMLAKDQVEYDAKKNKTIFN